MGGWAAGRVGGCACGRGGGREATRAAGAEVGAAAAGEAGSSPGDSAAGGATRLPKGRAWTPHRRRAVRSAEHPERGSLPASFVF